MLKQSCSLISLSNKNRTDSELNKGEGEETYYEHHLLDFVDRSMVVYDDSFRFLVTWWSLLLEQFFSTVAST